MLQQPAATHTRTRVFEPTCLCARLKDDENKASLDLAASLQAPVRMLEFVPGFVKEAADKKAAEVGEAAKKKAEAQQKGGAPPLALICWFWPGGLSPPSALTEEMAVALSVEHDVDVADGAALREEVTRLCGGVAYRLGEQAVWELLAHPHDDVSIFSRQRCWPSVREVMSPSRPLRARPCLSEPNCPPPMSVRGAREMISAMTSDASGTGSPEGKNTRWEFSRLAGPKSVSRPDTSSRWGGCGCGWSMLGRWL
jgi:hypothetical protein